MVKVRKKGADTCTDCQVLCSEFRMRKTHTICMQERRNEAAARDAETDDGDESQSSDSDGAGEDKLETEIELMEDALQKP